MVQPAKQMKVYTASKASPGMWEHKLFATAGLITSNSSILCIQKTRQMRRDKPETQVYQSTCYTLML